MSNGPLRSSTASMQSSVSVRSNGTLRTSTTSVWVRPRMQSPYGNDVIGDVFWKNEIVGVDFRATRDCMPVVGQCRVEELWVMSKGRRLV